MMKSMSFHATHMKPFRCPRFLVVGDVLKNDTSSWSDGCIARAGSDIDCAAVSRTIRPNL